MNVLSCWFLSGGSPSPAHAGRRSNKGEELCFYLGSLEVRAVQGCASPSGTGRMGQRWGHGRAEAAAPAKKRGRNALQASCANTLAVAIDLGKGHKRAHLQVREIWQRGRGTPQHPRQGTAVGGQLGWGNLWVWPSMKMVPGPRWGSAAAGPASASVLILLQHRGFINTDKYKP